MRFSAKGFTLMELMISVAILIVVIVGFLASFLHAIMLAKASRNKMIAVNDAQAVLESMKTEDFVNLTSYVPPVFSNLEDEAVSVTAADAGGRRVEVGVNVTWNENERQRSVDLYTEICR